jgi:plastocyanin
VLLALALATCGDDEKSTTSDTQPAGTAAETIAVSETEFAIDPANPRIDKPGSVEFEVKNDGKTVHALEIEAPGGEVETEEIQPGDSATLTANLDKAGRFEWYCPVGNHRELGMEGEVTVAGGAGQTDTTETNTTTTGTTETNTTETNTTETEPGDDSGGSGSNSGSGGGGGY